MLLSYRNNPQIVFRNWPAFCPQPVFDLSIYSSSAPITADNYRARSKFINAGLIRFYTGRFQSTVVEFT